MGYFGRRPDAYSEVVYVGGACVLRSLERSIGRPRMTALLRLLVSRHRHGVVTKADVLQAISEVAPPRFDLRRFLRRAHLGP
jgi:aminopeptidase N